MSKYLFTQWLGNNPEEIESFVELHSSTPLKVEQKGDYLMLYDEEGLTLPVMLNNFVVKHDSEDYIVVYSGYSKDELINSLERIN